MTNFWDYLKQVLPPETLEVFFQSIFAKAVFYLGEKRTTGMLVNGE